MRFHKMKIHEGRLMNAGVELSLQEQERERKRGGGEGEGRSRVESSAPGCGGERSEEA